MGEAYEHRAEEQIERLWKRIDELEAELVTRTRQRDVALDAVKAIQHHNCRDIDHSREIANRAMGKIRKS